MVRRWKAIAGLALVSPAIAGCATIVSGRHADVTINSAPEHAQVTVRDHRGMTVAQTTTPAVIPLKRGSGFFKRARYTATLEKPGYEPAQVAINSQLNPWLFGNALFGGVPGMIVDPYTGAMWKPNPNEVHQHLHPLGHSELAQVTEAAAIDPAAPEYIR